MNPMTPPLTWTKPLEPLEDLPGHLLGTIQIGPAQFHVDAVEVAEEADMLVPAHEDDTDAEAYLDAVASLVGGRPESMEIDGKSYVLCITPFQD